MELDSGVVVQIGDSSFEIMSPIGEGSFGVVWGAKLRQGHGGMVAIKETVCRSRSAVASAAFEGQILQALGRAAANDGDGAAVERIPACVACSTDCVGPEEWRVRLAMTFIPGEPLNRFLEQRWTTTPAAEPYHYFAEACFFARELVLQLAPALGRIASLAYHRDVNPRNIIVDDAARAAGGPRFGLIDFGLAVDATCWRLGSAETAAGEAIIGAWQVFGVGGDCRYWPVSAWLMLEQGPRALSLCPPLCLEYKTHLDMHALGISALQVFAEMAPPRPTVLLTPGGEAAVRSEWGEVACKLWALAAAWDRYWSEATSYWRRLFEAWRSGTGEELAAVKAQYRRDAIHATVAKLLQDLRAAIQEACEACERSNVDADLGGAVPIFHALLAMISGGEGTVRSSWRRIELLVERRGSDHDAGKDDQCREAFEALRTPRKSSPTPAVVVDRALTMQAMYCMRCRREGYDSSRELQ